MGVDDEYRAVADNEDSADHLLEKSGAITRSHHKKRSMFVSLAIGALIGAAGMFLVSLTGPHNTSITTSDATPTSAAADFVIATASSTAPTATAVHEKPTEDVSTDTDDGIITDCGSNAAEARAKGCVFDVMMQLWMQPACYDSNLSERYLAGGNWTWWADVDASTTLTLDEMRKGEHSVIYVIQDYHKQHCIFAWEKLVRAMRNEAPLIEELISYDHVMHCKHRTLSKGDDAVRGVRAPTGFTRCASIHTWEKHLPANAISSIE